MFTAVMSAVPASIDLNILHYLHYKELCLHPVPVLKIMDP